MKQELSPYFIRRVASQPGEQTFDLQEYPAAEEQGLLIQDYWRIIKHYRWLILTCAFVTLLSMGFYTFTRIPLYTAEATLLIDRKPPVVLKSQQDTQIDASADYSDEFYKTQYEILRSRDLAATVVRDSGLANDILWGGKREDSKDGFVTQLRSNTAEWFNSLFSPPTKKTNKKIAPAEAKPQPVGDYLSMLAIRPVQGTSLVRVSFTTPDPGLSARLANAHAQAYVRYGIDIRSNANEQAVDFLQRKLLELKERVEKSEAALNAYRRDKGILSVDDKEELIVGRLTDLSTRLNEAEADRIGLEAQIQVMRKGNYDALPAIGGSAMVQGIKNDLGRLESEYAQLLKQFKPGYPRLDNVKLQIDNLQRRLSTEIQNEVRRIESAYITAKTKESQLRATMEEQKKLTLNLKDSAVQYTILAREVDTNRQLYDSVLQRMKEMRVAADVRTSNVYVLDKAEIPGGPSYPDTRRSLLLGLLMGLAGGIGLAWLLDRMDNTLKTPVETERYLSVPNLAVIPDFEKLDGKTGPYLPRIIRGRLKGGGALSENNGKHSILSHDPFSVIVESYRSLRTAILLSRAGEPPKSILFTSSTRQEGKTATATNTAIIFAQMGVRTVLIDADLRRPRCHKLLDIPNHAGLTELLTGLRDMKAVLQETATENLYFISAGSLPPNPAELVGSGKMKEILTLLQDEFDCILVDSPPVMPVTDAVLLSTVVDGVVMVVNSPETAKELAREVRTRLMNVQAKILGVVLNKVDTRKGSYAYYRHYYHYYRSYREDGAPEISA